MTTPAPQRASLVTALALLALTFRATAATAEPPAPLEVQSVVLRLLAEAEVPAQEAGVLTAVPVREGMRVEQGDLVAQILDAEARLARQEAELALESARVKANNEIDVQFARKAAEVAEAELRRSTESIERFAKSVSQSQLDVERLTLEKSRLAIQQAEHELRLARLEVQAKENELAAAKVQLDRRRIAAPIAGTVVQVFVRLGEWVEPGQRTVRIIDTRRLKAEGFLPADQATQELVGAPVRLAALGTPNNEQKETFAGTVAFVSPEVDPITGQVRVWAEIDNPTGRLRPGQPVEMTIERG